MFHVQAHTNHLTVTITMLIRIEEAFCDVEVTVVQENRSLCAFCVFDDVVYTALGATLVATRHWWNLNQDARAACVTVKVFLNNGIAHIGRSRCHLNHVRRSHDNDLAQDDRACNAVCTTFASGWVVIAVPLTGVRAFGLSSFCFGRVGRVFGVCLRDAVDCSITVFATVSDRQHGSPQWFFQCRGFFVRLLNLSATLLALQGQRKELVEVAHGIVPTCQLTGCVIHTKRFSGAQVYGWRG